MEFHCTSCLSSTGRSLKSGIFENSEIWTQVISYKYWSLKNNFDFVCFFILFINDHARFMWENFTLDCFFGPSKNCQICDVGSDRGSYLEVLVYLGAHFGEFFQWPNEFFQLVWRFISVLRPLKKRFPVVRDGFPVRKAPKQEIQDGKFQEFWVKVLQDELGRISILSSFGLEKCFTDWKNISDHWKTLL